MAGKWSVRLLVPAILAVVALVWAPDLHRPDAAGPTTLVSLSRLDMASAHAERLCFSGDCPCFDEPYRTQCFAERKRAEEEAAAKAAISGQRQTAKVYFREPKTALGEKGYMGASFDIEYQLITCMGELHLAYSVVEDSVTAPRLSYFLKSQFWETLPPSPKVLSVPVKGEVYDPDLREIIGTFGDGFAAKSLGFGCFTGQTKEIAKLKDLKMLEQFYKTPEERRAYIGRLRARFETNEMRLSAEAERDIVTKHPEAFKSERAEQEAEDQRRLEAENEAKVRAQYEEMRRKAEAARREEQERIDTYNRQVVEHEKQLAENQRQVAAAAEARRQFEEKQAQYDRDRAAWEAQVKATRK